MVNLARLLAPRLAYRIRHGRWCDHADIPLDRDLAGWMLAALGTADAVVDAVVASRTELREGHVVILGWSEWELADLGRMKIRHCWRCGHLETTLGHPIRETLARWFWSWYPQAAAWWWVSERVRRAVLGAAFALVALGWFVLVLYGPPTVVIVTGFASILVTALAYPVALWRVRRGRRRV